MKYRDEELAIRENLRSRNAQIELFIAYGIFLISYPSLSLKGAIFIKFTIPTSRQDLIHDCIESRRIE